MDKRLIEVDFPLQQTSLDSVHEKSVRHGHLSTLHIWPARRPLAACRAALVATLLQAPADKVERDEMLLRLAGKIVKKTKRKKLPNGHMETFEVDETEGGLLHWGRESGPDLKWFRDKIREEYGDRAPKVLDPFAGGGAIPLEAMRLGCEATAVDLNPVAWMLLRCTLEYPQRLSGERRPLPTFALESPEFREAYRKQKGKLTGKRQRKPSVPSPSLFVHEEVRDADLAWHVRAWGWWVLQRARADLERFYPALPRDPAQPESEENPLCPPAAYLWARTVPCKRCGAIVPLLKTRWLCKKENKRVLLTMEPSADGTGVIFGVQSDVPQFQGNNAEKREHDRKIGQGTINDKGVWCPCCGKPDTVVMDREDIKREANAEPSRLGTVLTAVVVQDTKTVQKFIESVGPRAVDTEVKAYRAATDEEQLLAQTAAEESAAVYGGITFGVPNEPLPLGASRGGGGSAFTPPLFGLDRWDKLFTPRQLFALGVFVKQTRAAQSAMDNAGYPVEWREAVSAYLALAIDRLADRGSTVCHWDVGRETIANTFVSYKLPISWDFSEANPMSQLTGGYSGAAEWIGQVIEHNANAGLNAPTPHALRSSAIQTVGCGEFDVIVTDPPYYDAIPYSDLMDFFYIWLRRTLHGLSPEIDSAFSEPLGPKWNGEAQDGELIDDASRFSGDRKRSKAVYEEGMFRAFQACYQALKEETGRLVIVFAHKHPDAWETLVSALIRAGFVVDASWPIQTEMGNRTRAQGSAALSSSVWLVCRKRPETARPGWDSRVMEEMRANITEKMRYFWAVGYGSRGPDFVWAATGPALEAFSRYPVVKRANDPGKLMGVKEFLRSVRRIVVEFAVGHVLDQQGVDASELDDVTTYYLLHRHDFGLKETPVGPCILYAVSCGLTVEELADRYNLLARTGGKAAQDEEEDEVGDSEACDEPESGTGSQVKLKPWNQRNRAGMGYDPGVDSRRAREATMSPSLFEELPTVRPKARGIPLIDQIHRVMHLMKAEDPIALNEYVETRALRRNELFDRVLQALHEMAPLGTEERELWDESATTWPDTVCGYARHRPALQLKRKRQAMNRLPWKPWHTIVKLREEFKQLDLSLSLFAADLYAVAMGQDTPLYRDAAQFFERTYATQNLCQLVKEVLLRLDGRSDRAVQQLALTYGGGKTHTLVTLYHLVRDPDTLPYHAPAVKKILAHADLQNPPKARVAMLAFDRLDISKGMKVASPADGVAEWRMPWSVLAWQLAGREGMRMLGCAEGEERETPPFTNVLEDLLRLPAAEGITATLILLDEVLMWARTIVGEDELNAVKERRPPVWRSRIQDFFQNLTQATVRVQGCAIVASLLANSSKYDDELGKQIKSDLGAIFRRESEAPITPVEKEDVADVLNRRFFESGSIPEKDVKEALVQEAIQGIYDLDEETRKEGKKTFDRYVASYPFHPDLTDVLYAKWTALPDFQQARGILRTFGHALRDSQEWGDRSPLVATNVFLNTPDKTALSASAGQFADIASQAVTEGPKDWAKVLESELEKARAIQNSIASIGMRTIEQAVLAVFLHGPTTQFHARTRDLMILLGHTRPNRIELERALSEWVQVSWYLDESALQDAPAGLDGRKRLPRTWRLGLEPNLRQMHDDARARIGDALVEAKLDTEIRTLNSLIDGAKAAGAKPYKLPERPTTVDDDGAFQYAVLGPKTASEPNKPSAEAERFLNEITNRDNPRANRNAILLAVPEKNALDAARTAIRNYLGWTEVEAQLRKQDPEFEKNTPYRAERLREELAKTLKAMPEAIRQAYCMAVTVGKNDEALAFRINVGPGPLFNQIKADDRARIQDTAIEPSALLPDGTYGEKLWRAGDTARRVRDLVGAFSQNTAMPKMLNRQAIFDTLVLGCRQGDFVLRWSWPPGSDMRATFWREQPNWEDTPFDTLLADAFLEVVLPETAILIRLDPTLLAPGELPGLWQVDTITMGEIVGYFAKSHVVMVRKEGYSEPVSVPQAGRAGVEAAVTRAVEIGKLWLTSGAASLFEESIPDGILTESALLQGPPPILAATEILPDALPAAWQGDETRIKEIVAALSAGAAIAPPWKRVRSAIEGAIRSRLVEIAADAGVLPREYEAAQNLRLILPATAAGTQATTYTPDTSKPSDYVAEADLQVNQIQDLAEQIGAIKKAAAGLNLKFRLRVALEGEPKPSPEVVDQINALLVDVSDALRLRNA